MAPSLNIQPVIMSGGAGTRLWPMSRRAKPKQFLNLASDKTLFQETAMRVAPTAGAPFLPAVIIGGGVHVPHIEAQLGTAGIAPAAIITEPMPRNTAAVAAVAAAWTDGVDKDALILLMPADHHIADPAGFRAVVEKGAVAAADGAIVTFGIQPTGPHTGFGYIECGKKIAPAVYSVAAFKEKPVLETARRYIADGGYYWNAGIFLFSAKTMLVELAAHAPQIKEQAIAALRGADIDGVRIDLDPKAFGDCPSDSIDYAVMEKTKKAAVVGPVDVGWSDIGSWSAIEGAAQNTDNVSVVDAKDCLVKTDGPMVGVIGVENLIVVATGDAVLVMPRGRAQDVKKIVEDLKRRGRNDLL